MLPELDSVTFRVETNGKAEGFIRTLLSTAHHARDLRLQAGRQRPTPDDR